MSFHQLLDARQSPRADSINAVAPFLLHRNKRAPQRLIAKQSSSSRRHESGYTLVALIALMSIMAILAMAIAPSLYQQNLRSREAEAIARGEEVAEAIRLYTIHHGGKLPTSMDQLLEGDSLPGRTVKIQILRPEAARDPLSKSGEWKLIKPQDAALIDFVSAFNSYAGTTTAPVSDIFKRYIPPIVNRVNFGSSSATEAIDKAVSDKPSAEEDDTENTEGPFIGVASRSRRASVITYYGIDHHDGWIFTPAINPRCDKSPVSCE